MNTYLRIPIALVRGKGCWVWDDKGNRYLDAVAGIATCSLGHSDNSLRRALNNQLNKLQHVSNLYQIPEQENLAKWLTEKSCANSVFFCNSGAEANEGAIKLARKYAHLQKGIDSPVILSAKESFHGRTLATISATGQPKYHKNFEPLVTGFEFFEYNNWESFEALFNQVNSKGPKVGAVLIEPLQGEGGVIPGNPSFFACLSKFCNKNDVLLIFDEVQTGMGRTGNLWGYEKLGVEPDLFTLAKGLGGGHSIGAILVKNKADIFEPGDHASTFGGNPFACVAGFTVANEIDRRNILYNVLRRSSELKEGLDLLLNKYPNIIQEIRGWGLIQGMVIHQNQCITTKEFINYALKEKLLLTSAGANVIRLVPPLTIRKREIAQLLKKLDNILKEINT